MLQKADYLKNVNFVSQKMPLLGYLMLIFTVHDFFRSFITFLHSFYIKGTFCGLLSWLKKLSQQLEANFQQKNNLFFTPSKQIIVYIRN
jgi:hypothetical protein